jgi:hypothetical protein
VTGTRGHKVVVWSLPDADEVNVLLKAKIKLIDQMWSPTRWSASGRSWTT